MKNAVKSRKRAAQEEDHTRRDHGHSCAHDHGHGECGHDHGLMCEIGIRKYRDEDFKALTEIWKAGEIELDDTDSQKALAKSLERKDSFGIFVAEAQMIEAPNSAVGKPRLAGGVIVTYDGRRAYIYHFAVHRDFRGVGVGKALLQTCEQQAKLWGARHLRLTARKDPSRDKARRLYENTGWVPVENLGIFKKTLKK